MRRQISGLGTACRTLVDQVPDGLLLVRLQRMQFHKDERKPYYTVTLRIDEPRYFADRTLSSRLYCTPKAVWKLSWFLRDFGYDAGLLDHDEVDEKQVQGLTGVVKISHFVFNGRSLVRLDGFAAASRWEELSPANVGNQRWRRDLQLYANQSILDLPASLPPPVP